MGRLALRKAARNLEHLQVDKKVSDAQYPAGLPRPDDGSGGLGNLGLGWEVKGTR